MKKLNFWVIKVGEPAIFNKKLKKIKPLRAAMVAQHLCNQGNDVTWWTSNFQHHDKSKIFQNNTFNRETKNNLVIEYIPSIGYKNNVSIRRFIDQIVLAKNVSNEINKRQVPDLIFCAWPLIELTDVFCKYAKKNNIPIVIDIRDQWPDFLYRRFFEKIKISCNWKFLPYYEGILKKCFLGADSLISISPSFLNWAYERSGRKKHYNDAVFRLSSIDLLNISRNEESVKKFWDGKSVNFSDKILTIVLVGTLLPQNSLYKFIDAIKDSNKNNFQFVICGSGQLANKIKSIKTKNIIYAGYVDQEKLSYLLEMSDVGLLPYDKVEGFTLSIPNKVGEYLSCGLHILTSLKGEISKFFDNSSAVTFYDYDNPSTIKLTLKKLHGEREKIRENKHVSRKFYTSYLNEKVNYKKLALHLIKITKNYKKNAKA